MLKQLAAVWAFTFSIFNLILRLGNVKQSAIFSSSHPSVVVLKQLAAVLGTHLFLHEV